MDEFPSIERYRRELRATDYERLTDRELAEMTRRSRNARHSSEIEGIFPSAEQIAFDALLLDERVPTGIANALSDRFIRERLLAPVPAASPPTSDV